MLTSKDVNDIISASFITQAVAKKTRTGISPSKVLNPQPISSTIPCTHLVAQACHIIDIQDDPKPATNPYTTIITEQPPLVEKPQFPPPETVIPSQTIDPEHMQVDYLDIPE
jgi:hypothetical protein